MFYPDYEDVANADVRRKYEKLWGAPLSQEPGLTVVEIINAANAGEIKGMYIMGENPAMSDPDLDHARAGIAKLEHLVVQDIFLTETAMMADVVLPSSAWPEKNGTVTNTNRQVQMGRKALDLPGDTQQDLWIAVELAKRLGLGWTYAHPSEVFAEMKLAMPSLDNITWERLQQEILDHVPVPRTGSSGRGDSVRRWFSDQDRPSADRARGHLATRRSSRHPISACPNYRTPARTLAHRSYDAAR